MKFLIALLFLGAATAFNYEFLEEIVCLSPKFDSLDNCILNNQILSAEIFGTLQQMNAGYSPQAISETLAGFHESCLRHWMANAK